LEELMMNMKILTIVAISIYISGCSGHSPIVDTQGVDMSNYENDLAQCQQYAKQVSTGKDTAVGAGLGAALGWAISAVGGGDKSASAGVGAVTGGAAGLGKSASEQKYIISRCLQGRGY
jgi:hypothetical protein